MGSLPPALRRSHLLPVLVLLCGPGCQSFSVEDYCARFPSACHPKVTKISRSCFDPHGGEEVTISGSGFNPDTVVQLNGIPVETTWEGTESLSFVMPPGTAPVEVTVEMRGETALVPTTLHYAQLPELLSISAHRGSTLGGRELRVTARNLWKAQINLGSALLGLGSTAEARKGFDCTDTAAHELVLTTPAGPEGSVEVSVSSPAGTSTHTESYEYIRPWTAIADPFEGGTVTALALDPSNRDRAAIEVEGAGLFIGDLAAGTWRPVASLTRGSHVSTLGFDTLGGLWGQFSPGYVGVPVNRTGGVFASVAPFEQWVAPNPFVYRFSPQPDGALLALRSDSHVIVLNGRSETDLGSSSGIPAATSATTLYSTNDSDFLLGRTFQSSYPEWTCVLSSVGVQSGAIARVLVRSSSPDHLLLLAENGLYEVVVDRTQTCAPTRLLPGPGLHGLVIEPGSGRMIVGTEQGLVGSTDGLSWTPLAGGPARPVMALALRSDGQLVVALRGGVVVGNETVGWRWVTQGMTGGTVSQLAFSPTTAGTLHALTQRGLFTSADDGLHWALETPEAIGVPRQLAFDQTGARAYLATSNGVWRAQTPGTWAQLSGPRNVLGIAASRSTAGGLYLLGDGRVWRSQDGGDSWTDITAALAKPSALIAIAVTSDTPEKVLVAGANSGSTLWTEAAGWQPVTTFSCSGRSNCQLLASTNLPTVATPSGGLVVQQTTVSKLAGSVGCDLRAVSQTAPQQIACSDSGLATGPLDGSSPRIDVSAGLSTPGTPFAVTAVAFSPLDPDLVLVGLLGGGIARATNGGR